MASGIYLNESVWSSPLVEYNKKQNQRVVDLRWKKRGRIMLLEARSYYKITTSPSILKKKNKNKQQQQQQQQTKTKKGEMRFFENIFSLDFFNFLAHEHSKSILWRNLV